MSVDHYKELKTALLEYIQSLLKEIEEEMMVSHQEKYALLEDALENATDQDELKVAFEQWYNEHAADLSWDYDANELWSQATGDDSVLADSYDKDDEEDEELEEKKTDLEGFGDGEENDDKDHRSDFKNSDEY